VGLLRSRSVLRSFWKLHRFWWRVSGGRIGARVGGLPVLELIATGHRSGEHRSVLLTYLEDPRGFVVIASNAGSDRPPAWWQNLQADPNAVVRRAGRRFDVTARELEGQQREGPWAAAVRENPEYESYRTATSRPIPVILLERHTGAPVRRA
jgi:deazaflavin-dependent oxidoreductase (nitroreductase family)